MNNPRIMKYRDYSYKGKKILIKNSIQNSLDRIETYKPHKTSGKKIIISDEMKNRMKNRFDSYEPPSSNKFHNHNSILAQPLGAEVCLNTDSGLSTTLLGTSRYYFHELDNPQQYPDAQTRFPYDDSAHKYAKIITHLFRHILNRKIAAAIKIQTIFRGYNIRQNFHGILKDRHDKAMKIKIAMIAYKHRLWKTFTAIVETKRAARKLKKYAHEKHMLAKWPIQMARKRFIAARRIQKWFRKLRKERVRRVGRLRRKVIHAMRLQAFFRGRKQHRLFRRIQSAQITLAWFWRREWKRKYYKYAVKIQRAVRQWILRRRVVHMQKIIRGLLARRNVGRIVRKIAMVERNRGALEQQAISKALERAVSKFRAELPMSAASTMQAMDLHSFKMLHNITDEALEAQSAEEERQRPAPIKRKPFLKAHPMVKATFTKTIVRAVLQLLVNRPGGRLDEAAIAVANMHLSYSESEHIPPLSAPVPADSIDIKQPDTHVVIETHSDAMKEAKEVSAKRLENKELHSQLPSIIHIQNQTHKASEAVQPDNTYPLSTIPVGIPSPPLVPKLFSVWKTVNELEGHYHPNRALALRVMFRGFIPDLLLARAVLVRKFTAYSDRICLETIQDFRKHSPSKFACAVCLQPFGSAIDLRHHIPCVCKGLKHTSAMRNWVRKESFTPLFKSLISSCEALHRYPTVSRNYETVNINLLQISLEDALGDPHE